MSRLRTIIITAALMSLGACGSLSPTPDYSIKVTPTADGNGIAAVPKCVSWSVQPDPFDNQPLQEFGCADARNLAMEVDRPQDLIQGRDPGPAVGVTTSGSILRYYNNQTRGLVYLATTPDNSADATTASTATSGISGETPVPGGASSGSSSTSGK